MNRRNFVQGSVVGAAGTFSIIKIASVDSQNASCKTEDQQQAGVRELQYGLSTTEAKAGYVASNLDQSYPPGDIRRYY